LKSFLQRFGSKVSGVLNGFDRLRFRGSNRALCHANGILAFLCWAKVLLKDFGSFAEERTNTLCNAIEERATKLNTPAIYVPSSRMDKEKLALAEAGRLERKSGLIAVLGCVEPCRSVVVRKDTGGLLQSNPGGMANAVGSWWYVKTQAVCCSLGWRTGSVCTTTTTIWTRSSA